MTKGPARWDVHNYAPARAALTNPSLTRSTHLRGPHDPLARHVLNFEGANHQRVRAALGEAIDNRLPAVAGLAAPLTEHLLSRLVGEEDVAARVVRPLVLTLVDELLGLSGGDDVALRWWHGVVLALEANPRPRGTTAIQRRLEQVIAERRRAPRADVISQLAGDERISADDLPGTVFFCLTAAYVNTVNFLGLALLALAEHPDEYAWLREHPDGVASAVDELLRYCEPPLRASSRIAAADTVVAGRDVREGTVVYVYRSRANRDPERFGDPDRLDLRRSGHAAGSLAFGVGAHYCLGAQLVRVVADITLLSMLPRVDKLVPTARTKTTWDFADELWLEVVPATTEDRSTS